MTGFFEHFSTLQMGIATGVFIAALVGLFIADVLFTAAARVFATALAIAIMMIIFSFNIITVIYSLMFIIYQVFIGIYEKNISDLAGVSLFDWSFTEPSDRYRRKNGCKYKPFDGTTLYICKMDELDDDFRVYMIDGVAPADCKLQIDSCGSFFPVKGETVEDVKSCVKSLYGIDKIYDSGTYDFF